MDCRFVVPIVNDSGKNVSIRSDRNGDEEVTRNDVATIGQAGSRDGLLAAFEGVRQVEQDAAYVRVLVRISE